MITKISRYLGFTALSAVLCMQTVRASENYDTAPTSREKLASQILDIELQIQSTLEKCNITRGRWRYTKNEAGRYEVKSLTLEDYQFQNENCKEADWGGGCTHGANCDPPEYAFEIKDSVYLEKCRKLVNLKKSYIKLLEAKNKSRTVAAKPSALASANACREYSLALTDYIRSLEAATRAK